MRLAIILSAASSAGGWWHPAGFRPATFWAVPLAALALAACGERQPLREAETAPAESRSAKAPEPRPAPAALPATPDARVPSDPATPALAVDGEGLRLFDRASGRARPLPFGTPRADLERALAFRGPPGTGSQQECGAGPLAYAAWPDGLKLYYVEGKFTGWALDGRAAGPDGPVIGTAAGVGPGATRKQLTDVSVATFEQTSLGQEFRSGAISGLLDNAGQDARITDLWAGVSCLFR